MVNCFHNLITFVPFVIVGITWICNLLNMDIHDEEDLTPFEVERQRNIIRNYEFLKSCGNLFIV